MSTAKRSWIAPKASIPANLLRFDGRVAVVTGSGRGLGREYALLLGQLGAAVIVNSTTNSTAKRTVEDITNAGGKASAFVGDVSDRAVADEIVKTAVDTFGRIDIVINNAGWADVSKFDQTSDTQLWNMLKFHVGGSWNVTQAAWPHFKRQNYGRIIMTTSTLMFGGVGQAIYGAAKLALVGLVKSMALEGKDDNILINSLAPSGYTPGAAATIQNEQVKAIVEKHMPASEVAPMVLWLVHSDNRTTGESFGAAGRLVSRIFVAQTDGFLGSPDQNWNIEMVRENWEKVVDEKGYTVPTDAAEFGPKLFERLSNRPELAGQSMSQAF